MRCVNTSPRFIALGLGIFGFIIGAGAACSPEDAGQSISSGTTVFEGARLIAGDGGQVIEDAVLVVEEGRFTQVGPRSDADIPDGALRVDLAGRIIIPAFINAHMHLSSSREELIDQLRHNAYYGAAAVASMGQDTGNVPFQVRDEIIPSAARSLTAGRGITRPEPGRSDVPFWIDTEEDAREAVTELATGNVDIIKIWVDDRGGQYEKLTPELYGAVIDEAHRQNLRVTAHIFALEDASGLLRAGIDAFAHGVRDQDVDDEFMSLIEERPDVFYLPNLPNPGVARDLGWLSGLCLQTP